MFTLMAKNVLKKSTMNKELFTRIFYGGVIGDAMGVPYEFREKGTFKAIPEMIGHGTYNQLPGTWSDDTSLMLLLMKCLTAKNKTDNYIPLLKKYWKDGYMTPDNVCFDIGITTVKAIQGNPNEKSAANGALMRALPFLYFTWNNTNEEREQVIKEWSVVTHPNEISTICCIIYINLLRWLVQNKSINGLKEIANNYFQEHFKTSLNNYNPGSVGYSVDTLITAVWAVLHGENYSDIILKTIDLGGDTDTNALIAGTLAATLYPINDLWYDKLRRKDLLESVLFNFLNN